MPCFTRYDDIMVRRFLQTLALLGATLTAACSSSDAEPAPDPGPPDVPDASASASLAFAAEGTITLGPGDAREVGVVVDPPDVHVVRFALLGESLDASLDADKKVTSDDGRTSVVLTAPSTATTFRLRASAGENASAEIAVSVSGEGFASVRVIPSYKGIRSTPTWTASAVAHAACSELPGMPPEDGPLVAIALDGTPAVLDGLPVGPGIAVTLRHARSVAGCAEITDLSSGEIRDVVVKVSDIPVNMGETELPFRMVMEPDGSAALPLAQSLSTRFLDNLFPLDETEAKRVLDAMTESVVDPDAFTEARLAGGWDALLEAHLDDGGELLRERVQRWLEAGLSPLRDGETVEGRLVATAPDAGHGVLELHSFHGLDAQAAGIPQHHVVSLIVEPGDQMIVGGTIPWLPSRLMAAAAEAGMSVEAGEAVVASEALAKEVGCYQLPSLLEAAAPLPASCGETCLESACTAGLGALWDEAKLHSTILDTARMTYTVSGTATVNSDAVPTALEASWVGAHEHDGEESALKGVATAGEAIPQTR